MNPVDFILIGLIVIAVGAAIYMMIRRRKTGCCSAGSGCCGDCSSCHGNCSSCKGGNSLASGSDYVKK